MKLLKTENNQIVEDKLFKGLTKEGKNVSKLKKQEESSNDEDD